MAASTRCLTFPTQCVWSRLFFFSTRVSVQDKGILWVAAGVFLPLPQLDHRTHRAQRQGGGRPSRRQGQDGGRRLGEQHHPVEHPGRRQWQRDRWAETHCREVSVCWLEDDGDSVSLVSGGSTVFWIQSHRWNFYWSTEKIWNLVSRWWLCFLSKKKPTSYLI